MAALPWFIYLIVGIVISVYSRIVMGKSNLYVMNLFYYLGIIFFGIGVYKLLMGRWRNKITPKSNPTNSSIVTCKVCGTKNYRTSFFCHICGAKIEKKSIARS